MVLISTIFFSTFGIENWKILARIWAVIPVLNGIVFLTSPIYSLHEEGLKVSKTVGDLAGPMAFAGFVSSSVGNNLRMGILAAIVFPVLLLMGIQICKKSQEN